MDPRDISDRSRGVALALAAAIGPFGAHRFYVGKIGTGLAMLCTLGGLGIWWIYDVITIAAGAFRDMDGKRVWQWAEPGSLEGRDGRTLTPEHYDVLLTMGFAPTWVSSRSVSTSWSGWWHGPAQWKSCHHPKPVNARNGQSSHR
jgi:hypothetical protein